MEDSDRNCETRKLMDRVKRRGQGPFALMLMLMLMLTATATPAQDAQQRIEWNQPFAPFCIIGNIYYVGTRGLSAFLITGPKGHILIDAGLPESAPLIADNIRRAGFRLADVKYLLINHTHFDHAGGLAELKRLTGAKLIASAGEVPDLIAGRTVGRPTLASFPAVQPDRIVRDGDTIVLGSIRVRVWVTPGHTQGGVTISTVAGGKKVLFVTSLTVAGQRLIGDPDYPTAADDFTKSFKKLRAMKADVFLNFHPEFFDMEGRRARQLAGDNNAFVDSAELGRQLDIAERDFTEEKLRQMRNIGPR